MTKSPKQPHKNVNRRISNEFPLIFSHIPYILLNLRAINVSELYVLRMMEIKMNFVTERLTFTFSPMSEYKKRTHIIHNGCRTKLFHHFNNLYDEILFYFILLHFSVVKCREFVMCAILVARISCHSVHKKKNHEDGHVVFYSSLMNWKHKILISGVVFWFLVLNFNEKSGHKKY